MKKKNLSIERRNSRNGFLFVLPWLMGVIMFFLIPLVQSIVFSFSKVTPTTSGFDMSFVGLDNYHYALYESPEYVNHFLECLTEFAYKIPIILILSLILAVMLNGKFKGRTFFRSLFFVPVIIAGSVVMTVINAGASVEELGEVAQSAYLDGLIDFQKLFLQLGLPSEATNLIFGYVDQIFDLVWQCGVQTVLFISGLQAIPEQLYEVSKVEGATKWEEFWYITVPMLGHTIVLVLVFTIIEFCVRADNPVIEQAYSLLVGNQVYGKSTAMLWIFFVVIAAITGAIFLVFKKLCLDRWS